MEVKNKIKFKSEKEKRGERLYIIGEYLSKKFNLDFEVINDEIINPAIELYNEFYTINISYIITSEVFIAKCDFADRYFSNCNVNAEKATLEVLKSMKSYINKIRIYHE